MRKIGLFLGVTIGLATLFLNFAFKPNAEMGGKKLFKQFLTNFEKGDLPYNITYEFPSSHSSKIKIDEDNPHLVSRDQIIPQDFSAFVPDLKRALYSRSGPDRYYFKDIIHEDEEIIAVTVGLISRHSGGSTLTSYQLATYSKKPKLKAAERLISLHTIASSDFLGFARSCSIDKNLRIKTLTTHFNDDSEVIKKKETYQIVKDGKIKIVLEPEQQNKKEVIRAN